MKFQENFLLKLKPKVEAPGGFLTNDRTLPPSFLRAEFNFFLICIVIETLAVNVLGKYFAVVTKHRVRSE